MKSIILRWFFKIIRKSPAEMDMVRYWKRSEGVKAKVIKKDGAIMMQMSGEKYIFPGFPRSYLLYGKFSKLKHEIKNQIFNDSWALLEQGVSEKEVAIKIKRETLPKLFKLLEEHRFDMIPPQSMVPPVREIHRAWTKAVPGEKSYLLRDMLCYVLQEDDSYGFRAQWLITYFNPRSWWMRWFDPIKLFDKALGMLEHGEVIGDMKERQRLLRRILMTVLKDDGFKRAFLALVKECDWNKVKMGKAEKYFFRGKYFKVDLNLFDY